MLNKKVKSVYVFLFLAIELWLEYVQFAIGVCSEDEVRNIFEKGLKTIGLNVKDGHLLWDNLREFEVIHLQLCKGSAGNSKEEEIQLKRLTDIFKRQLSLPLDNIENTWEEFNEFVEKFPNAIDASVQSNIEYAYKKASKQLKEYQSFESQLLVEKEELKRLNVYREYLKNVKDPSLINNIYERALVEYALNGELWNDYCIHVMDLNLGIGINDRAIRNCPWYEDLWVTRLRILEYESKQEDDIMRAFEEGVLWITSGIELWITYLEYVQRNISIEKFEKLYEQFDTNLDIQCKLMRFAARVFAKNNQVEIARKIWSNIVYKLGKTANNYLEFIAFERQYGDVKSVRILMQKAINSCRDYPDYLADEWLMYERTFGTLKDVIHCQNKCKSINKRQVKIETCDNVRDNANKMTTSRKRNSSFPVATIEDEVRTKKGKFELKSKEIDMEKERKYRTASQQQQNANYDNDLTVFVSNLSYTVDEDKLMELFPNATNIHMPLDRKGKSRCFAYCSFKTPEEVAVALSRDRERLDERPVFISECKPDRSQRQKNPFKYSNEYEKNKLFVKGLPFVSNQEAVENIFKPYGATSVRLVTKKNGQSKGCAYVDFENEVTAAKALKETDGLTIGEHTIVVAISNPQAHKQDELTESQGNGTRNSRSKLSLSLIPRGIQLMKAREQQQTNKSAFLNVTENKDVVKKSNEDFRKMLLNPSVNTK